MVKLPTVHDLSNGGRRLRTDPRIEAEYVKLFDTTNNRNIVSIYAVDES